MNVELTYDKPKRVNLTASCEATGCTQPATTHMALLFVSADLYKSVDLCDMHAAGMRDDLTPEYHGSTHLYLMWDPGSDVYQFGKTDSLSRRLREHRRDGFEYLDSREFGPDTSEIEQLLISWLAQQPWRLPHSRERWYGTDFAPASIENLLRAAWLEEWLEKD